MKKALFWVMVVALVIAFYRMPDLVENSIPSIYYVTPTYKTYENIVSCTGTVQAEYVHEVYVESPSLPESVHVAVGDRISRGDLLSSFKPLQMNIPYDNQLSLLQQSQTLSLLTADANWAAIAALYSISSAAGGGLSDYSQLSELLSLVSEQQISEISAKTILPDQREAVSPSDGIVTAINLREGVPALPGIAAVTISDDSGYKVLASVAEADISRVEIGNEVKVRCTGYSGQLYTGVVTKIHPTAHKTLRGTATETVVDVEIRLANADSNLKPGFTAKVEIMGGLDHQLITVPYEAIRQDENNDEYVFTYHDGKIEKSPVMTGQELTNEVEILQGLTTESIVVYNPGDIVKEGAMIHLKGRANVD